jgi:hypothetical protein
MTSHDSVASQGGHHVGGYPLKERWGSPGPACEQWVKFRKAFSQDEGGDRKRCHLYGSCRSMDIEWADERVSPRVGVTTTQPDSYFD